MKTKIYLIRSSLLALIFMFLVSWQSYAADYTVSFAGTAVGQKVTTTADSVIAQDVDSVIVQNVTKGTKVTVRAGNALTLSAPTSVSQLTGKACEMRIYPNPIRQESTVTFFAKEAGSAQIHIFGLDGKNYGGKNKTFDAGENSFQLSLPKGAYLVKVSGNGYSYVTKAISQASSVSSPNISLIEKAAVEASVAQKSKVQLRTPFVPVTMEYTAGDVLIYKGFAGNFSAVVKDVPTDNKTITFNFSNCTAGASVFFEDFHWLAFTNTTHVFWDATFPIRFDSWTVAELAYGWTSTPNTFASNAPLLYATLGGAKLGRTSQGGDMISPKLSNIVGTQNVVVQFNAVPYMTNAGDKDEDSLTVSLVGPGVISTSKFIIDNWPTYPAFSTAGALLANTDPKKMAEHELYCIKFWREPTAVRTFTITGATSETQIKFLGGKYNLPNVGTKTIKNRLFIDDIIVYIPN